MQPCFQDSQHSRWVTARMTTKKSCLHRGNGVDGEAEYVAVSKVENVLFLEQDLCSIDLVAMERD